MVFLTEDLVSSVKRRTHAPSSQKAFQDSDIIALLNEELLTCLVPDILSLREDFFMRSITVPMVAGVNHYQLPGRAIGDSLKDVFFTKGGVTRALDRDDIRNILATTNAVDPNVYCFLGDEIMLDAVPASSTGTLTFYYLCRPSELVPTTSCSKIVSISSLAGTTTFTVDTDLTGNLIAGDLVDVVNAQSPFIPWAQDSLILSITSTEIALASADVENEASIITPGVGDYISAAQTANVTIGVPSEFGSILAQMACKTLLISLGDMQKLEKIMVTLAEMRRQAFTVIANRTENSAQIAINRTSILNQVYRTNY